MPQPRVHPKSAPRGARVVKTARVKKHKAQKKALTAEQLYEQAQAALAFDNYETALECFKDALQLEPENVEVLDAYGALLAEVGQREQAIEVSQQLSQLTWHLCLAQKSDRWLGVCKQQQCNTCTAAWLSAMHKLSVLPVGEESVFAHKVRNWQTCIHCPLVDTMHVLSGAPAISNNPGQYMVMLFAPMRRNHPVKGWD